MSRIPYHWSKLKDGRTWYRIEVRGWDMVEAMKDKLEFGATGEWMAKVHAGATKMGIPTRSAVFMIHDYEDFVLLKLSFRLDDKMTWGKKRSWANTMEPMKMFKRP